MTRSTSSLTRRTAGAVLIISLLLLGVFTLLVVSDRQQREAQNWVEYTQNIIGYANRTERLVIDLETGVRGYLITNQRSFLEPYSYAADQLPQRSRRLVALTRDKQATRQARVLQREVLEYLYQYAQPLTIGPSPQSQRQQAEYVRQGKLQMDRIRAEFTRFEKIEDRLRISRKRQAELRQDMTLRLEVIGLLVVISLLMGFVFYVNQLVVDPARKLARAARRLEQGNREIEVEARGDTELSQLAKSFNSMARSLVEQRDRLERQNAALKEADRLKNEFLALVSHELRTPLTSIIGYLDLLLEEEQDNPQLPEETLRWLGVVHRNAQRLLRLVGDLLFVAQLEGGELSIRLAPVDLNAATEEAMTNARPVAESRSIELSFEPPSERLWVLADPDRLGQVLDGLISNAIKFSDPDTQISVRLARQDGFARIEVQDQGMGISLQDQAQVFERFYRSEEAGKKAIQGAGLGLTIIKAIVEGHGGQIELHSEPGQGTCFVVTLPLDAPSLET